MNQLMPGCGGLCVKERDGIHAGLTKRRGRRPAHFWPRPPPLPVLFILFIKDLEFGTSPKIGKFADDTKLPGVVKAIRDYEELQKGSLPCGLMGCKMADAVQWKW